MDTKRFHNPAYKRQIKAVRQHRRKVNKKPEEKWRKALFVVGLGGWKRQVLLVLILAAFVYLSYFAPFLVLKRLEVQGADPVLATELESLFHEQVNRNKWFVFPQDNIVFFSSRDFTKTVLSQNYRVSEVKSVNKRIIKGPVIEVVVAQRLPKYTLVTKGVEYTLHEDGFIGYEITKAGGGDVQIAGSERSVADMQVTAPMFPRVVNLADEDLVSGQRFLSEQKQAFLNMIQNNFEGNIGMRPERYEVPGSSSNDLVVYTGEGQKFIFDSTTDPDVYLKRLRSVWGNIGSKSNVRYVDMRFDPNVYVCMRGESCAQE